MDGSSPLYDRLIQHEALNRASFHTPGHKGRFFDPSLLRLDYTELPDTDALYEANDVILRTEQRAAELFGAGRSLISAGGCSLAIQTMLRLAAMRGVDNGLGRHSLREHLVNGGALRHALLELVGHLRRALRLAGTAASAQVVMPITSLSLFSKAFPLPQGASASKVR